MDRVLLLAALALVTATSAAMAECPPPRDGAGEYSTEDNRRALCQQDRLTERTDRFGVQFQMDADRRALDSLERRMDQFKANQDRQLDLLTRPTTPSFNF